MRYTILENSKSEPISLSNEDILYLQGLTFSKRLNINPVAGTTIYSITAENVVGVLALPSGGQIHIRPKIGLPNLLKLLSVISEDYSLINERVDYEEEDGVFDLIGYLYLRELSALLQSGIRKDYVRSECNLNSLKGKINFPKHLRANIAHPGRLVCLFFDRQQDIPENRILIAAAQSLLRGHVCSLKTQKGLRNCLGKMSTAKNEQSFSLSILSQVQIGRHNLAYKRPLFLASLILRSVAFRDKSGGSSHPSFLLDVSTLFERYISVCFANYLNAPDLKIVKKESSNLDIQGLISIEPDFVIKSAKENQVILIADTKYKNIESKTAPSDVYQMLAYMINRNCRVAVLIYPETVSQPDFTKKSITIQSNGIEYNVFSIAVPLNDPSETAKHLKTFIEQNAFVFFDNESTRKYI